MFFLKSKNRGEATIFILGTLVVLVTGLLGTLSAVNQKRSVNLPKKAAGICDLCGYPNGSCHRICQNYTCTTIPNNPGVCDVENNNDCSPNGASCGNPPTPTLTPKFTPFPLITPTLTVTPSPGLTPTRIPSPTPTLKLTPTVTPKNSLSTVKSIIVSGYVREESLSGNLGLSGATVRVHKTSGQCSGQHWGCNPTEVITNQAGFWSSTCTINEGETVNSIGVSEIVNPPGYKDGTRYPDPAGGQAKSVNFVCHTNLNLSNIGPIVFYDLPLVSPTRPPIRPTNTITPSPRQSLTPTKTPTPTFTPTLTPTSVPTPTVTPEGPTATPTPRGYHCSDTAYSGGLGTHIDEWEMDSNQGEFGFSYDAYHIPDRFQILYEDSLLFDTNELVSGQGAIALSFGPGISTKITVKVTAPLKDTRWIYKIFCSASSLTPTPTAPIPTPTPREYHCQEIFIGGSQGTYLNGWRMDSNQGRFDFFYEARSTDRFQIFYEGSLVFDLQRPTNGSRIIPVSFGPGTSTVITVKVIGSLPEAYWKYQVRCPKPLPTPLPRPPCNTCDFNHDDKVCPDDIKNYLEPCWGKPATGNCADYDFNGDGNITIADIQICSRCVNIANCPSPAPVVQRLLKQKSKSFLKKIWESFSLKFLK